MKCEYIKENFEELKEGIKFELEKTLPQDRDACYDKTTNRRTNRYF